MSNLSFVTLIPETSGAEIQRAVLLVIAFATWPLLLMIGDDRLRSAVLAVSLSSAAVSLWQIARQALAPERIRLFAGGSVEVHAASRWQPASYTAASVQFSRMAIMHLRWHGCRHTAIVLAARQPSAWRHFRIIWRWSGRTQAN
ncbi:MAG: hypothetical protein AAF270_09700 [Pseudomonadota bacterium]